MLVGFEEGLLEHVLGVLVVLGDVLGEAVDFVLIVIDQLGEGGAVAGAGLGDQRGFVEGDGGGAHGTALLTISGWSDIRPDGFDTLKNKPMNQLQVTLPDGSVQSVAEGTRPIDVPAKISQRLADDAIVARVNGTLWDLSRPLEADAKLEILTTKSAGGSAGVPAFDRAPAGGGGAGAVSGDEARDRAADRERDSITTSSATRRLRRRIWRSWRARMWEIQARDLPYETQVHGESRQG